MIRKNQVLPSVCTTFKSQHGDRGCTATHCPLTRPVLACRMGVCGNDICEVGERSIAGSINGSCLADCPVITQPCTSGCVHGTCLASSGVCQCFPG
jgi:hypothetical protein